METLRKCTKCGKEKPLSEFHRQSHGRLQPRCKTCRSTYGKNRWATDAAFRAREKKKIKEYHKKHPEWYGLRHMRKHYGGRTAIPIIFKLYEDQAGACAICRTPIPKPPHRDTQVDHCHTTGKIRGILCRPCNSMLGFARDSEDILSLGIDYLRKTTSAQ